jgi:glycosyltransferase involved in cell wall biosynthesis
MKVAIIGTVGVPACYGGFETLVENLIGEHCSPDVDYTVFCSSKDLPNKLVRYKNASLKYIPFKANGAQSLIYDTISLLKVLRGYDIILYLGASVPIFSIYKRICKGKIIMNIDGLSQFRDKYSNIEKKYLAYIKNNEITMADVIVADNKGMQDYVTENYSLPSRLIAYGGDQVLIEMDSETQNSILVKYHVAPNDYAISVCRIEPENNCHMVLEAFEKCGRKLMFIGNWDKSEYGRELKSRYKDSKYVKIQDPIYDLKTLFALRNNASLYVHGHSVGGTNPSLVEAMFFGIPIICFDVVYNRATTFGKAGYFKNAEELIALIQHNDIDGEAIRDTAFGNYTWKFIVEQYEQIFREALGKGK